MFIKQSRFIGKLSKFLILFFLIGFLIEALLRITGQLYLTKLRYNNFINTINSSPQDIRILCLGESTTTGLWVDYDDSYPKQLEKKLREFYKNNNIKIIIPPHMGQNTSQVSNRIENYIKCYKPKLIILMVGANNEWSLSENHVVQFLHGFQKDILKIKFLILLDSFRLFKVLRYYYLTLINQEDPVFFAKEAKSLCGAPLFTRWPPKSWVLNFAVLHKNVFIKLWRYDVQRIIGEAKNRNVKVLLMTYAASIYVPFKDFVSMARENNILLVRNEESFKSIIESRRMQDYFFCKDNWHPNKNGYSLIANNAFEYIRNYNLLGLEQLYNSKFR